MSIFLTSSEKESFDAFRKKNAFAQDIFWNLVVRSENRAASPGLMPLGTTTHWWHCASEHVTDAAITYALKPSPNLRAWLRETTLSLIRRPITDWVGPSFRNHDAKPPIGHLETAHLSWTVAVALDLAKDVFTPEEVAEIKTALHEKGITLCQNWINQNHHMANWRCVLNAGVAVAAAVIEDDEAMENAIAEFHRTVDAFQPDGSYSESLQYGNYAAYTLMLTREALVRRRPELENTLPLAPYIHKPRWDVASYFYQKPLSGWGAYPRPRSANFNDSSAIYRASADLLLHIAARGKANYPTDAGLARWLFDTLYLPCIEQGPHDQATFGFINDFGFLTIPLLPQAAEALTPEKANLPLAAGFSCGDVLVRDAWPKQGGKTILAIHGAGDLLHGPGHLHGDLNSFILVHNKERLLLDPGHSCYRNLIHDAEGSSMTHNTCTFEVSGGSELHLQEDLLKSVHLQQSRNARRTIDRETGKTNPPVHRGGKQHLLAREGEVTVVASEIADLYGKPITEFTRIWILCGSHALFVIDRIKSSQPVKTSWSWLLNNRDDQLDLKLVRPDRAVARRGYAGMKIFHLGDGKMQEPIHAYVHDAYHPKPNQLGEGKPGSGALLRWIEKAPSTERVVTHAIAMDTPGAVAGWHLKTEDNVIGLEAPGGSAHWKVEYNAAGTSLVISEAVSGQQYKVIEKDSGWKLNYVS